MNDRKRKTPSSLAVLFGWIGQDDRGDYYCLKFMPCPIALRFEEGAWHEVDFETAPKDIRKLSSEEAFSLFADVPPQPLLEEIDQRRGQERDSEFMELTKKTPRKVIGWTYVPEGKLRENDAVSYDAAVVDDFIRHGYRFSGEDFDELGLKPVFDTYEYEDFTWRGFGTLMAVAHGDHSSSGYMDYSYGEDLVGEKIVPKEGLYPEYGHAQNEFEISEGDFDRIVKAQREKESPIFLFAVEKPPKGTFYFPNDRITLFTEDSMRHATFPIALIQSYAKNAKNRLALHLLPSFVVSDDYVEDRDYLTLGLLLKD